MAAAKPVEVRLRQVEALIVSPGAEVETQSKALKRVAKVLRVEALQCRGKSRRHRATKAQAEAKQGKVRHRRRNGVAW